MKDLDDVLDAIDAALDAEDVDEAVRLAKQARRDFPSEPDVRLAYADTLWDAGDLRAASTEYKAAVQLAPLSSEALATLAWCHVALVEFEDARTAASKSMQLGENAHAAGVLCLLAERAGELEEGDRLARRAHALDPEAYPLPYRVSEEEFRAAVSEALDNLPESFRRALEGDVAVLVEPVPSVEVLSQEEPPLDPELLGLYVGVPLPERDSSAAKLPDIIYLFQRNLEHAATGRRELIDEIRTTVYHEVGHYFGFDEEELEARDLG